MLASTFAFFSRSLISNIFKTNDKWREKIDERKKNWFLWTDTN